MAATSLLKENEYRDKEMRKSNIIIFNIPEPKSMENAERKKEDITVINAIAEELGSTALDIVDVVRHVQKFSLNRWLHILTVYSLLYIQLEV